MLHSINYSRRLMTAAFVFFCTCRAALSSELSSHHCFDLVFRLTHATTWQQHLLVKTGDLKPTVPGNDLALTEMRLVPEWDYVTTDRIVSGGLWHNDFGLRPLASGLFIDSFRVDLRFWRPLIMTIRHPFRYGFSASRWQRVPGLLESQLLTWSAEELGAVYRSEQLPRGILWAFIGVIRNLSAFHGGLREIDLEILNALKAEADSGGVDRKTPLESFEIGNRIVGERYSNEAKRASNEFDRIFAQVEERYLRGEYQGSPFRDFVISNLLPLLKKAMGQAGKPTPNDLICVTTNFTGDSEERIYIENRYLELVALITRTDDALTKAAGLGKNGEDSKSIGQTAAFIQGLFVGAIQGRQ